MIWPLTSRTAPWGIGPCAWATDISPPVPPAPSVTGSVGVSAEHPTPSITHTTAVISFRTAASVMDFARAALGTAPRYTRQNPLARLTMFLEYWSQPSVRDVHSEHEHPFRPTVRLGFRHGRAASVRRYRGRG